MTGSNGPLTTLLLPGLEGTGRLFSRFIAQGDETLRLRVLSYPADRYLGYDALEELVVREVPTGPFAILGESFGGPLALRIAARAPAGLVGVVLAASFHRRPAARLFRVASPLLGPAFFRLPLPPHAVRLLLAGQDAPDDLVQDVQDAVASVRGSVMSARAKEAFRVDATALLRSCRVPLLFLGGKHDRLLRTALPIEIRALRADAEIRMLEAPHLVLQRCPDQAMKIVRDFLLRAASRMATA